MSVPSSCTVPGKADQKRLPSRRWRWYLLVIALILLAGFLARNVLLRGAAGLLVDENPLQSADFVLPLGDPQSFAEAARLCRSGAATAVLLVPPKPDAAQVLGILPTDEERMQRELTRAQAADRTVTTLPCPDESDWRRVRLLGDWLAEHPDARVTAVCARFQSARWRCLLRAVLPAGEFSRVRLAALAHTDPDYDETNWWRCKEGMLDALNSSLGYAHVLLCGEDQENPPWDPDQYEKKPALKAPTDAAAPPSPRPRRRWKRWALLLVLVLLAALWLARVPLLTAAGRWLDVSDPPAPADCVMVLGGDHDYRPMAAAALYKAGLAHRILVPSFRQRADALAEGYPPEEEVIRRVLEARGVPTQDIQTLEGEVDSTADEAASLARYLDDHPGLTVAVVTTDYHTRRSRWIFERRCAGKTAALHFISAPAHGFDAADWWRSERGFTSYLDEYAKLTVYWLRG